MKFYIAFSIHGTNKFYVATREIDTANTHTGGSSLTALLQLGSHGFTVAASRRPKYNVATDGIKLHWNKLCKKNGQPHTNPVWVKKRFAELQQMGWTMVEALPH